MKLLSFLLNLPWTLIGLLFSLISLPIKASFRKNPYAIILRVKTFWWAFGYLKNVRAVAIGHVVILGLNTETKDLEHELIHLEQFERLPLIFPILYYLEMLKNGYEKNKYEIEAYKRAGNVYNK